MEYIKIDSERLGRDVISRAISILKNSGVIALPTETVYGLVGDISSKKAVEKIYKIKGRQFSKPLSIFIPDIEAVYSYVDAIPDSAYKLMNAFWPGPLTIVLLKKKKLIMPFESATLGFRMPDHPVPLTLLKEYGALVSTSANPSGKKDALSAEDVKKYFDGEIDLVLDGDSMSLKTQRQSEARCWTRSRTAPKLHRDWCGVPSTVVVFTEHSPKIVREGKITKKEIKKIINI